MIEDSLSIDEIKKILPHRYPFLFIDRVLKRSRPKNLKTDFKNAHIVARKSVSVNEPFFEGHFPDFPIMPGVLQIEAMAQACALLVLTDSSTRALITTVNDAKFRAPVLPGDVLSIEASISNIKMGKLYFFEAKILNDKGTLVSQAKIGAST